MSRLLVTIGFLQALTILVALVRSKVLSVILGPAGFGVVSTIDQIVLTLASLGAIGMPFTALKFMAHAHSESAAKFQRTSALFLRVLCVLGVLTVGVTALLLLWRPGLFGADMAIYGGVVLLAVAGVPAVMLNILFINTFAAAQRPTSASALGLIAAAALGLAAVVGVSLGGVVGLYVATVVTGVLTAGAVIAWLRKSLSVHPLRNLSRTVEDFLRQPRVLSYSLYFYLALGAYSLTMLELRTIVFGRAGAEAAGLLHASLTGC